MGFFWNFWEKRAFAVDSVEEEESFNNKTMATIKNANFYQYKE
jgi:hypothetical protein